MTYCRFSCDNWKSDVYCYQSTDGSYTTFVADIRYVGKVPELPDVDDPGFIPAYNRQMKFIEAAEREKIDLDGAGQTYYDADAEGMLRRLVALRKAGFHIPQHAIDALEGEIAKK